MSSDDGAGNGFRLFRRTQDGVTTATRFSELFDDWSKDQERWLFISPHDDDVVAGGGLLLQKAVEDGVDIAVRITTNGNMGYCDPGDQDSIVDIRRRETLASFGRLSVKDIDWLGYADNDLYRYAGRRPALDGDPGPLAGFTGLQNSYTHVLRSVRPTRVFVPGQRDFHPDHKLVYQEVLISLFHAGGAIWPELGRPLASVPSVYEMAVYCPFEQDPDIKIEGCPEHLAEKTAALRAYQSQRQIESVIQTLEDGGPVEYVRDIRYRLYSPSMYAELFAT